MLHRNLISALAIIICQLAFVSILHSAPVPPLKSSFSTSGFGSCRSMFPAIHVLFPPAEHDFFTCLLGRFFLSLGLQTFGSFVLLPSPSSRPLGLLLFLGFQPFPVTGSRFLVCSRVLFLCVGFQHGLHLGQVTYSSGSSTPIS